MIHVAIWGAGDISYAHADALLRLSDQCRITAVCNRHVEKAERLIRSKGLDAVAVTDMAQALQQVPVDMVTICLSPAQHPEAVVWAAEHGLHALVEKPMANSLEECDRMIDAARRNGVQLGVICQRRFSNEVHRVRQLLQQGTFGRVLYGAVNSMWWRGEQYHDAAWRGRWAGEGGGVLTAQAIHDLDMMQYLIGQPSRVTAVMGNVAHGKTECEDVVTAILEYPGAFVQFSAALVAHGERRTMEFHTEKGLLSVPWAPAANKALPSGFPQPDPEGEQALQAAYDAIPPLEATLFEGQFLNFLRAIRGEEPLNGSGEEGRRAIELTTAIYRSAAQHTPITLPLGRDDPFYTAAGKAAGLPHFHEKA